MNHLSDSVSIVEVDPTDIDALARHAHAARRRRAARHRLRRQRRQPRLHHHRPPRPEPPGRPQLTTAGHRRARWCRSFDANSLGAALGGTPLSVITRLRRHAARARREPGRLARLRRRLPLRQPDDDDHRGGGRQQRGGLPPPPPGSTPEAPPTGLIVKFNTGTTTGRTDRPQLDAQRAVHAARQGRVHHRRQRQPAGAGCASGDDVVGVGTVLFNMAVRPDNGKLYVTNPDARNQVRFEPLAAGGVQGTSPRAASRSSTAPRRRRAI